MTFPALLIMIVAAAEVPPAPTPYGPPPPWEDAVRLGNAAIARTLIDPESARIEWPYTLIGGTLTLRKKPPQNGWYTCGYVNAKNRLGGYVGREIFLIMFQGGQPLVVEVGGRGGFGLPEGTCADLAKKGWLKPSGLEALGAINPGALLPTPQAAQQSFQTLADAGAQQPGGMGIALLETPAGAVIMSVTPGSPAETAGLKIGQVIESLGGISVKGMPLAAFTAVMKGQPKNVEFKISSLGPETVTRNAQ